MNLYVSNLAYSLTDDDLRKEFAAYGTVTSARVVLDRETGRSRGFGFVEMPDDTEAQAALSGMEGANVGGRALRVVIARPKEERPAPRNFGGGGGGGGGPRGGGGGSGGGGGDRGRDRGGDRGGGGGGKRDWSRDRGGKREWDGGGEDF
ncbi:MAG TPA: RNA-binding protein [Prosthecobacter sp.]|nr:RNA-binding protein [Prosthecobacter sp.]